MSDSSSTAEAVSPDDSVTWTVPRDRMVDFGAAIHLFFKNYFQFEGRSSRGAYWYWTLASLLLSIVFTFADSAYSGVEAAETGPLSALFALATIVPNVALGVRRLHDIGRSGWWTLILFTGVGIIPLIYWACQPGQRKTNTFGPDREAGR